MTELHPFSEKNAPKMYVAFYKECDESGKHRCGLEWPNLNQRLSDRGINKKTAVKVEEIYYALIYNRVSKETDAKLSKQLNLHKVTKEKAIIIPACFDHFLEGNMYHFLKPFLPPHQDLAYNLETVNTLLSPYADELEVAYEHFLYESIDQTKTGLDVSFYKSFQKVLPHTNKTEVIHKEYSNMVRTFEEEGLTTLIEVIEYFNFIFTEWLGGEWRNYLRERGVVM